jgi:hypothetical protein
VGKLIASLFLFLFLGGAGGDLKKVVSEQGPDFGPNAVDQIKQVIRQRAVLMTK